MNVLMIAVNYSARLLVLVVGVLLVTGVVASDSFEIHIQRTFGAMMIAFGAYRTIVYHVRRKQENLP